MENSVFWYEFVSSLMQLTLQNTKTVPVFSFFSFNVIFSLINFMGCLLFSLYWLLKKFAYSILGYVTQASKKWNRSLAESKQFNVPTHSRSNLYKTRTRLSPRLSRMSFLLVSWINIYRLLLAERNPPVSSIVCISMSFQLLLFLIDSRQLNAS